MDNRIVITGGGTGGHLKVAESFVEELFKRNKKIIFIGSLNGQDKDWFENDKRIEKCFFLDTKGVVNKSFFGKIISLFNILKKTIFCIYLFKKYKVNKVISVGGFSAAPATFASILYPTTKLFIHEQNSKMGKLNELTSRFASILFSSFDNRSPIKDYPVSEIFFEKARIRTSIRTVAFFGGSQGAVAINDFALKLAPKLQSMNIKIIHQTGKNDFDRVSKEYIKLGINADVFSFSKDIITKMNQSDFAVSRAGASTLWEMTANCLPAYFVPYKYAAGNHQYYNAKDLVNKKIAFYSNEDDLDVNKFIETIDFDIKSVSEKLKKSISPNSVSSIIDLIYKNDK